MREASASRHLRRRRLAAALGLALAAHLGLLAVLARWNWQPPAPAERRVRIELGRVFKLRPAAPVLPPAPYEKETPQAGPRPAPPARAAAPPRPEPQRPAPAPQGLATPGLDVLVREAAKAVASAPPPAPAPRVLGTTSTTGPTVAELLHAPPPVLPGAAGEMELVFYSGGVHGDMQRIGDALSPEFGFRVPGLIEVRCKFMVVVFACAW